MRVRIVCYEEVNAWILGKFARKLNQELINLGIESDISKVSSSEADINHHIIYLNYEESKGNVKDSLMITHINDIRKLNMLKKQLQIASIGICMSEEVMNNLVNAGIPASKLCYINPAHDEVIKPRKIKIGITTDVKPDGCKRENLIEGLVDKISPETFSFTIMGSDWDSIVKKFRVKNFDVEYYSKFEYELYTKLMPTFDYFLYAGQDEGSMAYIDALAAGVKTIVTPQGFHLDARHGITHPFETAEQLMEVFAKIETERKASLESVKDWTWKNYAIKHIELWNYMLGNRISEFQSTDGLHSLLQKNPSKILQSVHEYKWSMYKGTLTRTYYRFIFTIKSNSVKEIIAMMAQKVRNRYQRYSSYFRNK